MSDYTRKTHHIVTITQCGSPAQVNPGHVVVGPEDKLTFQALDTGRVILYFPTTPLANERGDEVERVVLNEHAEHKGAEERECSEDELPGVTLTVSTAARPGVHPYAAYHEATCHFAVGGSHPKVIIMDSG